MKRFFNSLQLRLSDLFILIAGIFGFIVCIDGVRLMGVSSPSDTFIPFYLIILFFSLSIIFVGLYLFFEFKFYKAQIHIVPLFIFIILAIIGCLVIFLQPNPIDNTYVVDFADPI